MFVWELGGAEKRSGGDRRKTLANKSLAADGLKAVGGEFENASHIRTHPLDSTGFPRSKLIVFKFRRRNIRCIY